MDHGSIIFDENDNEVDEKDDWGAVSEVTSNQRVSPSVFPLLLMIL